MLLLVLSIKPLLFSIIIAYKKADKMAPNLQLVTIKARTSNKWDFRMEMSIKRFIFVIMKRIFVTFDYIIILYLILLQ